ncbi:hypothetical protein C2G38_2201400 [Gigaspora rosea]|uniref:Uncharacterized protein n=1 Tax=Gigaspora rosea TaxID=44941 RepID=A0A397UPH3_9GLOM|nr:hypothetical protein C2G38_2201400 [Gigaspora rosea]
MNSNEEKYEVSFFILSSQTFKFTFARCEVRRSSQIVEGSCYSHSSKSLWHHRKMVIVRLNFEAFDKGVVPRLQRIEKYKEYKKPTSPGNTRSLQRWAIILPSFARFFWSFQDLDVKNSLLDAHEQEPSMKCIFERRVSYKKCTKKLFGGCI